MCQSPSKPCRNAANWAAAAGMLLLQACAAPPQPAPAPEKGPAEMPAAPQPAARPSLAGRMTADAHEYPWSALGRVNLAGQGFCTGIVIGPQQVLTQARCLYNGRNGRWFRPNELHFIGAYQRDDYLADSPVGEFTVAPGFNPAGGISLSNLANNWAVVKLRDPIGNTTGWLGLEWDNDDLKNAAARGEAAYLSAGYRNDLPHAVNLHFGCDEASRLAQLCDPTPAERSLPRFVLSAGELRVLGDFFLQSPYQAGAFAAVTEVSVNRNQMGRGQPPQAGGLVGRQPEATVEQLLTALGYPVTGGDIDSAAAAFRRDRGLPSGGGSDIALMTALLNAAQHAGP